MIQDPLNHSKGLNICEVHEEWINLVHNNRDVAILAPTGFGKSEVLCIAYSLWLVYFNQFKEVLIVSNEREQSVKLLERIKNCIEDNELLKELIPESRDTWTKTEINLSTRCKIFCKSFGQGESLKSYHVDFVFGDEASSYDDPNIFFRYVMTRAASKRGKVCCASTPVSIVDLMALLSEPSRGFVYKAYPAIQNGKSIWPEKFPLEELEKIKKRIGVSNFEREYMVNPKAEEEGAIFPPDLVSNCFDHHSSFRDASGGEVVMGVDLAISEGPRADYDASVIIEKVGDMNMLIYGERKRIRTIEAKVIRLKELYNRFKPKRILVDKSLVGPAVIQELRKSGLPVEECDFHQINRNNRLVTLRKVIEERRLSIPFNTQDSLTNTFSNILVEELIRFKETTTPAKTKAIVSTGAHDDTVMALALAVEGSMKFQKYSTLTKAG